MRVARTLINWCDNKFNEALNEKDDRKGNAKAFLSGAVEGFVDAAIIMYIPVTIACYIWKAKATKK